MTGAMIHIPVSEKTLFALATLKQRTDEPISAVIDRLANGVREAHGELTFKVEGDDTMSPDTHCKYRLLFLGSVIGANSLGELYGRLIDCIADIDSEILERLASMKARTRRYVARDRDRIHPNRPDLKTLKTQSAWYVSKNVGRDDVIRGIKALCQAGSLKFGKDIEPLL